MSLPHPGREIRRSAVVLLGLLGLIGLAELLLARGTAPRGLALTADSVWYLSTAARFAAEGTLDPGFCSLTPSPVPIHFVHWPPAYPLLLAPAISLGWSVLDAAELVAGLLLAALMVVLWLEGRRRSGSDLIALGMAAWYGLAPGSLGVHAVAWSEPLFLLSSVGALAAMERARSGRGSLLPAAGLAALAALTRYVGVFLLVPLVVAALAGRQPAGSRRWRRAGLAAAAMLLPLGACLARNLALAGSLTGSRRWIPVPKLGSLLVEIWGFFRAGLLPAGWPATLAAGGLAAMLAGGLAAVTLTDGRRVARSAPGLLGPAAAAYALFLIGARMTTNLDPCTFRLQLPLLVIGLLAIASRVGAVSARTPRAAAATAVWGLALLGAAATWKAVPLASRDAAYLDEKTIISSPLVIEAGEHDPRRVLVSNRPDILNLGTGRPVISFPQLAWWPAFLDRIEGSDLDGALVALFVGALELPNAVPSNWFLSWAASRPDRVQLLAHTADGMLFLLARDGRDASAPP